jgi:hypothetical protein
VLPERGQHVSLTGGYAHPGSRQASTHTQIVPDPRADPAVPG